MRISVNSQIAPPGRVGLSVDLDRKSLLVAFVRVAFNSLIAALLHTDL